MAECKKENFSLVNAGSLLFIEIREPFQCCVHMYVGKAKNKNLFAGFSGFDVLQGTLNLMKCVTVTPTLSLTLTIPNPNCNPGPNPNLNQD